MMKIYCDGGARGNPGPAAAAFVVCDSEEKVIFKEARTIGNATNNVAEYKALIMALEWLAKNTTEASQIILDSELVKKQMTGEYRIRDSALQALATKAKSLEAQTPGVNYFHTSRAGDAEADRLVYNALDSAF